jgi:hypothetical protein
LDDGNLLSHEYMEREKETLCTRRRCGCINEIVWYVINLVLEGKDGADAAVDGVGDARLRLVADGAGRVPAQRHGHPRQHLRQVAGAEHLVHGRELRRAGTAAGVLPAATTAEVRREHAPPHASPP